MDKPFTLPIPTDPEILCMHLALLNARAKADKPHTAYTYTTTERLSWEEQHRYDVELT
jgi:hypothetical protein